MNKKGRIQVLVIALALAIAAGLWWYHSGERAKDTSRLVLYGNVDIREVDLTFNNSEHIDKLLVQEGDRVRKGQLVATLHRERLQAEYAAAEAKVASQKAVVARLESGSRPEEIRQARADVAAAKAKLVDAGLIFERTKKLYQERVASKQAVDNSEADYKLARANLKVAEEKLALAVKGPRTELETANSVNTSS